MQMLLGGGGGRQEKKGTKPRGRGKREKLRAGRFRLQPTGREVLRAGAPPSRDSALCRFGPQREPQPRRGGPSAAAQGGAGEAGTSTPAAKRSTAERTPPPPAPYLYLNRSGFVGRQINAIADDTLLPKKEQQVGRRSGLRGLRRKSYDGPYCIGSGHDRSTAGGGILPAGLTCAANTDMWQKDKQREKLLPPSSQGNWEKR